MKTWTTQELELKLQIPRSSLLSLISLLQARELLPPTRGKIRIPIRYMPHLDRVLGGGVAW